VTEVFAYGTLRDREYQLALFDRVVPARTANLPGWRAVVAEGGYLTIVRAGGDAVSGELLTLDDGALALADAWEEVPRYERIAVAVRTADGSAVDAQAYVRATGSHERAPDGVLTLHARSEVLAQIRALRRQERMKSESA
jgi:gamma-glutamylcyclotransferase (GGCT)/AIG2-like uncharacterized protein YtfP